MWPGLTMLSALKFILYCRCNDSHYIAVVTVWIVSVINHINTQAETDIETLVKISVLKHLVHIPISYYPLLK